MHRTQAVRLVSILLLSASSLIAAGAKPIVQNARVTVWDVAPGAPAPATNPAHDVAMIVILGQKADVVFQARGTARPVLPSGARAIVVELQDAAVPPLPNTSGYPLAFPRPGSRRLLENGRLVAWEFSWTPGEATAMHFHDKDVVVTYLADGALVSTNAAGESVVNEHHFGYTKFNGRDRIHTETLTRGEGRAVMIELK